MKHIMHLHPEPFAAIKAGKKRVEVRLNDEKRQQIQVNDEISFSNRANPKEFLSARVTYLHYYPTFHTAYIHSKDEQDLDEKTFLDQVSTFYSKEEVELYGVVCIGIQPLT